MTALNLPIPRTEADLSREWLRAALADTFPRATFSSLERARVGEAYGLASRIVQCRWHDGGVPRSVIVKLWSTEGKAGVNEVRFYQRFDDLGVRIPKCFYAAYDEHVQRAALVLEDLSRAAQGDCLKLLDLPRAQQVARSLARLQAKWSNHEVELAWLPNALVWTREAEWFRSRRKLFLERFPDRLGDLARSLLGRLEHAPGVANERLANATPTLSHGDFHLDNLMFERGEPVFLDWSRPVRESAAHNLAGLLFDMAALDNFDSVLNCYLDAFGAIVRPPERAVLERQLGGALLRKFAAATCGVALWQPSTQREAQLIEAGVERSSRAVTFWHERDPELFSAFF